MRTSDIQQVASERWDAIIVGTGIGGATIGYALAKCGWRVLFCEKGRARTPDDLSGDYAETFFEAPAHPKPHHATTLLRAGRFAEEIQDVSGKRHRAFIPFVGCGIGGSSALYGMAMERLFPADFSPKANHPNATGANLPEEWPISYQELAPYYAEAERLYRVRGTLDPLRPDTPHLGAPPPFTAGAAALVKHFEAQGLHPYRLPSACDYVDGCQSCQGYLCPKVCKNDSARVCLEPAIKDHRATLINDCNVVRLQTSRRVVEAVECQWHGKPMTVRGRLIVLAAGALVTPTLLNRSASPSWPNGLANDCGLVGRNLMRHLVDLYLIEPMRDGTSDNRLKEIAFNDFCVRDGMKLGSVQSFGRLPPAEVILQSLLEDIHHSPVPWASRFLRIAAPIVRPHLNRLIHRRLTLATTLEDLPYAHNRVELSNTAGSGILIRYVLGRYERIRMERFRMVMRKTLYPMQFYLIAQANRNERIAHACGTCRFGHEPRASVLDRDCRAHGVDNLYIVDSSFFPTSGSANPSLTIAANALRVARVLSPGTPG